MKRIKKIVTLILAFVMFLSPLSGLTAKAAGGFSPANVYIPAEDEAIQDPVLHWAVRDQKQLCKMKRGICGLQSFLPNMMK